jgi:sugar lactone lactonase YvrE
MAKVIIAGTRGIYCLGHLYHAIRKANYRITEVVSGTADGVDGLGELWAELKGLPVMRFEPDWLKHGRAAGPIRNSEMAKYADAAILVWDGRSKGTKSMIEEMKKLGKPYYIYTLPLE